MNKLEGLLTIKETADYLRVNPLTVYRLARQGMIPALKVGRHWRVHRRRLDAWLTSRAPRPAVPPPAALNNHAHSRASSKV